MLPMLTQPTTKSKTLESLVRDTLQTRPSSLEFTASVTMGLKHLPPTPKEVIQAREIMPIRWLSEHRRVELMILPGFLYRVVQWGASSALHPDSLKIKSLLADAMTECVAGLGEKKAEILTRRMKALREDVINDFFIGIEDAPWFVRGPNNAKIGLVLWYAVEQLLQDGTLELYEGSAMADALMMLPPMIDHVARIEGVDRSARKQAPKFIKRLQQAGYFKG